MKSNINRRTFLKTAAVASSASLSIPYIARAESTKKLRIAMIGVGGRAEYAVRNLINEKVVALCDVDAKAFTRPYKNRDTTPAGIAFPKAKRYKDYRELFEHAGDFDAVWIAVPDHHHYPSAIRAIRAAKAVYCEKPLAWSVWECQQLAAEAEKYKVATQMGNQGMANSGWRLAKAYIEAGAIGDIKEVHTWTGTRFDDGERLPEGSDPIPKGLDWDLWLGPAPYRPYKEKIYQPFKWRGWMDFGNGALGDWCCHLMNAFYKIYDPGYPVSVECIDQSGPAIDSYPAGKTIKWEFAAKNGRPAFVSYWYDGKNKPPHPAALEEGRELRGVGSYFVGTKGTMWFSGGYNESCLLIPETYRKSFKRPEIEISRKSHTQDFLEAAKGLVPYDTPLSNFAYGGMLTATALMGNIAVRVKGKLLYDAKTLKFTNSDHANKLLTRNPRDGWYI